MSVCETEETWLSNRVHSLELLEDEQGGERRLIAVLTPIPNTSRLLSPRIKHGTDDQKARRNGPFAHSEDETNDE
jgi:hypothetical protein